MVLLSFDSFIELFSHTNVVVGIILAILGFSIVLLAKRVTLAVRKKDKIENNDNLYLGLLGVALLLILVGLLVTVIR